MARHCRLDWMGAAHHVMARGVGKCPIFLDSTDGEDFLRRLSRLVVECDISLMAWVMMPNHIHLLTRTGEVPLGKFMQRLLTGYAGFFNREHGRVGHLFQNRFKSILVQEDLYFFELVRYIHLNPLRAGLVADLEELEMYPWCGHGGLTGALRMPWLDRGTVLDRFCETFSSTGEQAYLEYLRAAPDEDAGSVFDTGTIRIGTKGLTMLGDAEHSSSCGRGHDILGSREFASSVMERLKGTRTLLGRARWSRHEAVVDTLRLIERRYRLPEGMLSRENRTPGVVRARELACYVLMEHLGMSLSDAARLLRKAPSSVSRAVQRMAKRIEEGDPEFTEIIGMLKYPV